MQDMLPGWQVRLAHEDINDIQKCVCESLFAAVDAINITLSSDSRDFSARTGDVWEILLLVAGRLFSPRLITGPGWVWFESLNYSHF